ncbi:hypothetical protein VFC49_08800 [Thermococcus sp. SY098]|uniref:hypothetical protein n=1 Tax=Thermococcus sp. SY098 TaxID=3111325 RepID=UPI002D77AFB5|nr:hypothetical protein [Thermococcus sp. SY098]WRS52148.1 hypothetical protein VFC49_08800 [Thermococcus sp. SY098]
MKTLIVIPAYNEKLMIRSISSVLHVLEKDRNNSLSPHDYPKKFINQLTVNNTIDILAVEMFMQQNIPKSNKITERKVKSRFFNKP